MNGTYPVFRLAFSGARADLLTEGGVAIRRHRIRRSIVFHHLTESGRLSDAAAYAAAAAYFGAFVIALEAALSKLVY